MVLFGFFFLKHCYPIRITRVIVFPFPRSFMQKILLISWRIFLWKEKQISLRSGFQNINVLLLWQKQWTMSSLWMQIFDNLANEWWLFPTPHPSFCCEVLFFSSPGIQVYWDFFSCVFMLFDWGANIFLSVINKKKGGGSFLKNLYGFLKGWPF